MREVIKNNNEKCTGCNRCIRECPMETANITYTDKEGNIKVKIDSLKCITCGRCVSACKHGARYYEDDTERFFGDLAKGVTLSLIAAPSIRTNIPEYKRLFTYLKQLGVNKIFDVSLGADICIWGHIRYLEKSGAAHIITQPCPVVVTYCEMYRHGLLKKLSPIHSPMACASVYMRKYRGISDPVAALSPCMAKTNEFSDTGLAEYNITFVKLLEYMKENDIALPDAETEFDHNESGMGSLFPMPGGLKENIEYYMGKKLHIAKAEGFDLYEKLNQYAVCPEVFLPGIFDVLNCAEGCNIGTASSHEKNLFEIDKTMDNNRRKATEERKREYYESVYKTFDDTFDLNDFIREYPPVSIPFPRITTADINKSFELLGKGDYEKQHIDCGACGSDTCYGMARKIALGVNIANNCVFKSKEDAKIEHEENILAQQKLTEMEKGREADERMLVMLNANPNINILFNSRFKMIDCNTAAMKFLGFKTKEDTLAGFVESMAKSIPAFQPDGRASVPLAERLMAAAKDGFTKFETEFITGGVKRHLNVEFRKIPYEKSFAVVGYVFDMTEMRERELELANAHERNELQLAKLDLVVQATGIGLWDREIKAKDPNGPKNRITYTDEYRHMLGYTCENDFPNILGSWLNLIHPDDMETVLDALDRHFLDKSGNTHYNAEYRLRLKNGEYAYFHDFGETIRDESGKALHMAGALVNITETKNILLDTERQRAEADTASRSKSDFLANMSHEIRTPMNAIIGMTNIGMAAANVEQKDYSLSRISDASSHLLGVINDILDMSKIESGKFELSEVEFDLEKMFQRIANVISYRIEEKKHKFAIYIDRQIPQIMIGDDQRLAQVITNLVGNAVKFTPEYGSIKITTNYLGEKDGVCTIKIGVTDTGIGISPEQQAKLFQSFHQAEAHTSRKFGGTGLGLAISKSIVEMMGGDIWIESELGNGAAFYFTLKVKRGSIKTRKPAATDADLKKVRVLAVDEDAYILQDFKGLVEDFGATCDTALCAEDAFRLIEQNGAYHIHFVSWKMSGMDGLELAKELRSKISFQNNSLVIMVSFYDFGKIAEEAKAAGVDLFLQKPLFPSTIAGILDQYLGVAKPQAKKAGADISGIFKGRCVLLAEDVEINREIVMTLLEPTLLQVECAPNGKEAVRMFGETPEKYEMIFMDVQMPEMDGYEATRHIRAMGAAQSKTVPIIAMTANVFREDIEKCMDAGMNGHIGKPIHLNEVVDKLRNYLR